MRVDPAEVIREHARFVWRVLRHLGVPEDQLEDGSQEVFLRMFRTLDRYDGSSKMSTWLFGLCRNLARELRRSRTRRPEQPVDVLPDVATAEAQSTALERKQIWACIGAALQRLPEPTRMVFVLYELEHMEMNEAAASLDCNVNTAYSRLHAARDHVRAALARAGLIAPGQGIMEVL